MKKQKKQGHPTGTGGAGTRRARARRTSKDAAVGKRVLRRRVPVKDLTWKCAADEFDFPNTSALRPLKGPLGQKRALKTLAMGLRMQSLGYNLFVCGLEGAEATEHLRKFVQGLRLGTSSAGDYCYVHNFRDPHRPQLLSLPPGDGPRLSAAVHSCLQSVNGALQKAPEKTWRARARGVLDKNLPSILKRFAEPAVEAWLRDWRRALLADIHHAAVEDFEVNCVKHTTSRAVPVIHERLPSYSNLFGGIGRRSVGEQAPVPHFTEILTGSMLRADGGVLIIHAADLQYSPGVWGTLKSCLKYGSLQLEEGEAAGPARSGGLKPEPIPLNLKVVLVGDYGLYDHLFETELDFRDVFKLRVDFDTEIALSTRVLRRDYPAFLAQTCESAGLRPLNRAGVARVIEFAVRKAGRKQKVTTQAWMITDLLREADYLAGLSGRRLVNEADVDQAIREGVERVNMVELKISEMIADGTILITTNGSRIGQVNGLAIYDMGDYLFAKPSRITAETSVGQGGIINIEREAGFSGRIHDKGMQILGGYLRSRFAQQRPLSLTASLCFEQSYSGIDGDSASATEIYALLSSLAGLPIRQDVAVTGSLNQKGDVQPIGGVNEKIEGFFDCIHAGRPTGKEGVIIPRKNVNDLMLRADVVRAVAKGKFHVYAIDEIEEGIEILTGVAVGRRRRGGGYTPGSVFDRVDQRLDEIAQGLRKFNDGDG